MSEICTISGLKVIVKSMVKREKLCIQFCSKDPLFNYESLSDANYLTANVY